MKRVNLFIDDSAIEFLKTYPGTLSEHIRRAIDEYIEKIKVLSASASASKKINKK